MDLVIIFLTGLTTGGLSCLAMQGGLLASVIANQKKQDNFSPPSFDRQDWLPVVMFLFTKLLSHMALGFLLGLLGSKITLSLEARLIFQTFTALFMLATAMNLLNVHPVFRYLSFQPPKFLQRWVRSTSKSQALFAPGLLGLLTVFIPCGVTQAMEVLAINSASSIQGGLIMGTFVLGTWPLFVLLGVATAKLSGRWHRQFSRVAAIGLIAMALYGLNGVLVVLNSPLAVNSAALSGGYFSSDASLLTATDIAQKGGVQEVTINVLNGGYQPARIRVKSGVPVKLTLESQDTYTCALSFVFAEFGINTFLQATDSKSFWFTPTKPGKYQFSCSMGMYTGVMEVI